MNIYNLMFLVFYKTRKVFQEKLNVEFAVGLVAVVQAFQVMGIYLCLIRLGLSDSILKSKILALLFVLPPIYLINTFYLFTHQKVMALIEEDSILSNKKRTINYLNGILTVILSFTFFFTMLNLALQKK